MKEFKELAKEKITFSRLFNEKEKISVDDAIAKFPDGFFIDDFEIIKYYDNKIGENVDLTVVGMKDENFAFFAGVVLSDIISDWVNFYSVEGYDPVRVAEEFKKSGGLKIRLSKIQTKNNRTVCKVDIL